jgi:hypothetical protein
LEARENPVGDGEMASGGGSAKDIPQGLKPTYYSLRFAARLKSCPDDSCLSQGFFRSL